MANGSRTRRSAKEAARLARAKEEARKAVGTGRHRDAIQLLEGVVQRAPEEWAAVLQLGDLYTRAGRTGPANALYRRLAEHHEEEGHHLRAAAVWQKVVRNDPSFHGAHLKLGALYAEMGRRVEARRHYERVLAAYRKDGREGEASLIEGLLSELEDAVASPRTSPADSAPDLHARRRPTPAPERPRGPPARPPAQPDVESDDAHAGRPASSTSTEGSAQEPPSEAPEPTTAGEAEYVEERLLQGRLFRRYGLFSQARGELEALLQRSPDHAEARAELRDVLQEMGEHAAAVEQQRHLETSGVPSPASQGTPSPSTAHAPLTTGDLEGLGACVEEPPRMAASDLDPLELDIFKDLGAEVAPDEEAGRGSATRDADTAGSDARQSPEQLARMVSDFRERVDAEIGGDDFETRYNLGIAYRGMGLLDEAVAEFQRAARDPERIFDCAPLLAACFVDKGLPQLAVSWLERGLQVPGRADEEYQELRYDLACALELVGDAARATEMFVELYGENARLRDVAERVKQLATAPAQQSTGTGGDASGTRRGVVLPWRRE